MAKKKAASTQTAVYNAKVPAVLVNENNWEATHPENMLNTRKDRNEFLENQRGRDKTSMLKFLESHWLPWYILVAAGPAKVIDSDKGSQLKAMVKFATHFTARHRETPGARMCSLGRHRQRAVGFYLKL